MKKSILECLLVFACFSASIVWAQEEKPQNWKFGINLSPEIGYRYLTKNKNTDLDVDFIMNFRDKTEKPALTFTAGLSAERQLSEKFTLRSGLQYSVRGEKARVEGILHDGTVLDFTSRYHYHFIGVPLNLSYTFLANETFSVFASIGADMNFIFMTSKLKSSEYNGEKSVEYHSTLASKDQLYDYTTFNPAATLSAGMDISLGNRSILRVEPNFRYSIRSIIEAPILGYYYNYGINFAYLLAF